LNNKEIIELTRKGHRKEAALAATHIVIPLGAKEDEKAGSLG